MQRLLVLSSLLCISLAKTLTYNWELSWVTASPDGFSRPVIGINGKWPLPVLEADEGDTIVVNLKNSLGNQTTGLHWHGLYQQSNALNDGPSGITQCPIPPGKTFTYQFTASPAGTSWYHSHNLGQYPDGLRGPLIIHDRRYEQKLGFDKEIILTISDWYHKEMPYLIHDFLSAENMVQNDGAEPIPNSHLFNDGLGAVLKFEPGKKYLLRIISLAAAAGYYIKFDEHNMTVVGLDSEAIKPKLTDSILITPGQRYDVMIGGKDDKAPKRNFAFLAKVQREAFKKAPADRPYDGKGVVRYGDDQTDPQPKDSNFIALDDTECDPLDGKRILGPPNVRITLDVKTVNYEFGQRSKLGGAPFIGPKIPTLYTALSTGSNATDRRVYGEGVLPYVLKYGDIVQLVVNNPDGHAHPFHMHGHSPQLVQRGSTAFDGDESRFDPVPVRRDTFGVPGGGHLVLRWKADNPGVWFFHCHIEWHVEGGMAVTFIEAPARMQESFTGLSASAQRICDAQDIPTAGNCAGEQVAHLDTSGCNNDIDQDPWGALLSPPT